MNQRILEMLIRAKNSMGPGIQQATASLQKLKSATQSITSAIAKYWLVVVAAITSFVLILRSAINAASAQEMAMRRLEIALTKSGGATSAQVKELANMAEALQRTTGFQNEEILSAQALLATMKMNASQITQTTPVLLDMAAALSATTGEHMDLRTVTLAVTKAMQGNAGILQRYGVHLDEATVKSGDFGKILEALKRQFGGFAQTLAGSTFQGAAQRMGTSFSDLIKKIGEVFTESSVLRGIMITLGEAFDKVAGFVEKYKTQLIAVVDNALKAFITMHEEAAIAVVRLGNAMRILSLGPANIGKLAAQGQLMTQLNQGVQQVQQSFSSFGTNATKAAQASQNFSAQIQGMAGSSKSFQDDLEQLIKKFPEVATAGQEAASAIRDSMSDTLFEGIQSRGKNFSDTMVQIFTDLKTRLLRVFTDLVADLMMRKLKQGLLSVMDSASGGGGGMGGMMGGLQSLIGGGMGATGGTSGLSSAGTSLNSRLLATQNLTQVSTAMKNLTTSTVSAAQATQGATKGLASVAQGSTVASSGMSMMGMVGMSLAAGLLGAGLGSSITGGKGIAGQGGKWGLPGAIVGGIGGFMIGGPVGAVIGAGAGGFLGGMFHHGGRIRASMRRADSGLSMRENDRVILAQTGEGVIDRQGMRTLGEQGLQKLNMGQNPFGEGGDHWNVTIIAMDSKSFADQIQRNAGSVVSVVQKAVRKNGPIRKDLRNYT